MQTLDFDLREALQHKDYEIPTGSTGLNFKVVDDKESVCLIIDGREIALTVNGARDLAMALRQSSNRVARQMFERLGKNAKKEF